MYNALRRSLLARAPPISSKRAFTAAPLRRIKEDAARSPETVDQEKEAQRRKAEAGKGEWHESLASASESSVAADREGVGKGDVERLQKETAEETQRKHPEAK